MPPFKKDADMELQSNELVPAIVDENSSLMISAIERGTSSNGAIEIPESAKSDRRSLSWINSKFTHVFLILFILFVILIVVLIIAIILAVRLGKVEGMYEKAHQDIPKALERMMQSIQSSIQNTIGQAMGNPSAAASRGLGLQMTSPDTPPVSAQHFGPSEDPRRAPGSSPWYADGCKNLGKCSKPGFETPPLVIFSFDGFAHRYLERGLVPSLEKMAECGATVEKVIPSYPSKTFPNHYTIATGLYPEDHGIVDNNVYDPNISDRLESLKNTKYGALWGGVPIWSALKKDLNKETACIFWPGCAYNISGPQPYIAPQYNGDLPPRNKIEDVLNILRQPKETRPALIMTYFQSPDTEGHYMVDDEEIDAALNNVERILNLLLSTLKKEGILECINLVILSDHGMARIDKTFYVEDHFDMSKLLVAKGVVGRIYNKDKAYTEEQLLAPYTCMKGEPAQAYTRATIPTRKHYSKSPKVGDIILQGAKGTMFYGSRIDDYHLASDHGYDFLEPFMHTIFFARGPSIKPKVVLPALQNIEYFNLWTELLGMKSAPPNNGTQGTMSEILVKPVRPIQPPRELIRECPLTLLMPGAIICNSTCSAVEKKQLDAELMKCSLTSLHPPPFSSLSGHCFRNYCNKTVIVGKTESSLAIYESLVYDEDAENKESTCSFVNAKYSKICSQETIDGRLTTSLSAENNSIYAQAQDVQLSLNANVTSTILNPLNDLTKLYLRQYKKLITITGTAYDKNHDGVADADESTHPTHLYRILLKCDGAWSSDGRTCEDPEDMKAISFLTPLLESDINCLTTNQFLLDYTARIRDVELISGLTFAPKGFSPLQALRLRTHIPLTLW